MGESGPKKVQGQAYTTESGERRMRLVDLKRKKRDDQIEVKLSDILMNKVVITEDNEGKEIYIKPINLKAMALLEKKFGSLEHLSKLTQAGFNDVIAITTILCNQDRPEGEHLTDDEVSMMIDGDKVGLLNQLVNEMLSPLFASANEETETPETTGAA